MGFVPSGGGCRADEGRVRGIEMIKMPVPGASGKIGGIAMESRATRAADREFLQLGAARDTPPRSLTSQAECRRYGMAADIAVPR